MKKLFFKQLELFKGKGLGALPQSDWSDRERYILALWNQMKRDGSVASKTPIKTLKAYGPRDIKIYSNATGYMNTIPKKMKEMEEQYFLQVMPGYVKQVTPIIEENKQGRVKIDTQNTSFTLGLLNIANLAYQIQGNAAVIYEPATGFTDQEKKIVDLILPLAGKDELRRALTGVNFDSRENEITVTDGHKLVIVKHNTEMDGVFTKEGVEIEEGFPNYKNVIPQNKGLAFKVPVRVIAEYLKRIKPFTVKSWQKVFFYAGNHVIGINQKYFSEIINLASKTKAESIVISLSNTDNITKVGVQRSAVWFQFDSEIGEVYGLIMPMIPSKKVDDEKKKSTFKLIDLNTEELAELIRRQVAYQDLDLGTEVTGALDIANLPENSPAKIPRTSKPKKVGLSDLRKRELEAQAQAQRIKILKLKYMYANVGLSGQPIPKMTPKFYQKMVKDFGKENVERYVGNLKKVNQLIAQSYTRDYENDLTPEMIYRDVADWVNY